MGSGPSGRALYDHYPPAPRLDHLDQLQDRAGLHLLPPKVLFEPTLEGYVNLFTTRTRPAVSELATLPPPETWYEEIARRQGTIIAGPSRFGERFLNSVIIGFGSTFLSIFLGTLAAYAFSRFRVPLKDDLMFFILSTRMMPPIAVAIPIYLMFRQLGLSDTHLGMILLYTGVNISLAVWLLKGFIDEIPREYEEAALIDGYTRFQAFRKVVLPQAATGIASTAIFCLIFAWNEYAFAVLLTSGNAQTAPPSSRRSSASAARTGPPWPPGRRSSCYR
jgi:multiple sugar transport system permease protein